MIVSIALDLGTTSIKAGLLIQGGALSNIVVCPAPNITVNDGRYESNALDYAVLADQVLDECLAQANGCTTFGLCSQRSSFLIWEQSSGKPITPLISWQDNRGVTSCEALQKHQNLIRMLSGLPLTPYYFAPKLRSLLLENADWLARLIGGELLVGTLDTFLIWRWTGGKHHLTDASMAARTLLMDTRLQQWSPKLCNLFGIPVQILPQIQSSTGMNISMDNGLTLTASVGDQSAALYASVMEEDGEALANLGTGCFVVRYLPEKKFLTGQAASSGYLHTLIYQDSQQHPHFAIEGTLNSIAAALAPYSVEECRFGDLGADDIFCIAEPSGLGAPYFRSDLGIRFSQSVEHLSQQRIACLLLEAVIFRVVKILEDFHREFPIERVYLSGGLSELTCLQQGIACCAPFDVYRLEQTESSLQGAVLLAAGMAPAHSRACEKISTPHDASVVFKKYQHWEKWLAKLLDS
ncbi:MAG: FGGY family carbohydrate kinase [Gallionella sp.]